MTRTLARVLALSAAIGATAHAQTAVLTGTVVRDSTGQAIDGAQISLVGLNRSATTNYRGEFRLDRLPAGLLTVSVRRLGFEPLSDTLRIADGARVDREFGLVEAVVKLDTVVTTVPERKYISPNLRDFEERRKTNVGGYFISEEVLRKEENRDMSNLIVSRIPGLQRFRPGGVGNKSYVGTARKCTAGPELLKCRGGAPTYCPVSLYIDGVLVVNAANLRSPDELPDLSTFRINEYAAIEFYHGGASIPVKYNATSGGCGVLLLWSRER